MNIRTKDAKKIETKNLRIEKNIISFNDLILQISNISQVSIEPLPKKNFNIISIVTLFLGIFGLIQRDEKIQIYGILFILITIGYFIWLYVVNSAKGKYLYLYMNSGSYYYIFCRNELFLDSVMDVIESCINNHYTKEINIDLVDCKLYNSPFVVENTNSAVVMGDNNSVIINDADWKVLQDELIKVYQKLPQSSEEYTASKKAFNYALNKDEKGLKAVLKEYAKSFTSDLFSGVASGVLVELISRLIK